MYLFYNLQLHIKILMLPFFETELILNKKKTFKEFDLYFIINYFAKYFNREHYIPKYLI